MRSKNKQPQIPLPKSWATYVNSGILHLIALAQYALTCCRNRAADSSNQRVRRSFSVFPGRAEIHRFRVCATLWHIWLGLSNECLVPCHRNSWPQHSRRRKIDSLGPESL
jgi:hypothetical protein